MLDQLPGLGIDLLLCLKAAPVKDSRFAQARAAVEDAVRSLQVHRLSTTVASVALSG